VGLARHAPDGTGSDLYKPSYNFATTPNKSLFTFHFALSPNDILVLPSYIIRNYLFGVIHTVNFYTKIIMILF
jgi:hypothetical protein